MQIFSKNLFQLITKIHHLNRVHVSSDMTKAFKIIKNNYKNCKIYSFKSGSKVGLWTIPKSWEVINAYLKDSKNKIILDYKKNPLCLWSYSDSFKGKVTFKELLNHIIYSIKKPKATIFHFRLQYRHWEKQWGFSIPYKKFLKLNKKSSFYINIKTIKKNSELNGLEQTHEGIYKQSILFVGHLDHPFTTNDGLAGCISGHEILKKIEKVKTKMTYRMLSSVEIIGSIFYAKKKIKNKNIINALFLGMPGADSNLAYNMSFYGKSYSDDIFDYLGKTYNFKINKFREGPGNDEIAFDAPGVKIPCGSFTREIFKNYHTDFDTPKNLNKQNFLEYQNILLSFINIVEKNSLVIPASDGLTCLSHPKLNLYLNAQFSQITDPDKNNFIWNFLPKTKKNDDRLFIKLNALMDYLCAMQYPETTLNISRKLRLPFDLVDYYTDLLKGKKIIKKRWHKFFKS